MDRLRVLTEALEHSDRLVVTVDGVAWEGYIERCEHGEVVAIVRVAGPLAALGQSRPYEEQYWRLDEIADVRPWEPTDSLAERLLRKRISREEQHHGRD